MIEEIKLEFLSYCVEIFDNIPSTNTYLCDRVKKEILGKTLVIAREQSGGRGRMGRTFHSPKDAGLYMSLLLPLENVKESEGLTIRIGVALYHALKRQFPDLSPTLKWVNDIYVENKKLAGILVEGVTRVDGVFCAVVGVGMNFLNAAFPEELKEKVTSIEMETGEKCAPISFVRVLLLEIEKQLLAPFSSVLEGYRENSYLKGKKLLVLPHNKEAYSAKYVDIDESGSLVVETETGEKIVLFSGDVSVKW